MSRRVDVFMRFPPLAPSEVCQHFELLRRFARLNLRRRTPLCGYRVTDKAIKSPIERIVFGVAR